MHLKTSEKNMYCITSIPYTGAFGITQQLRGRQNCMGALLMSLLFINFVKAESEKKTSGMV